MSEGTTPRVTGIGGIFFQTEDPTGLAGWYRQHLGVESEGGYGMFSWREMDDPERIGQTVWALFPRDSEYWRGATAPFMVNYRVNDLDGVLAALRAAGASVDEATEEYPYGRFGWATDPAGNRIELWEPREE